MEGFKSSADFMNLAGSATRWDSTQKTADSLRTCRKIKDNNRSMKEVVAVEERTAVDIVILDRFADLVITTRREARTDTISIISARTMIKFSCSKAGGVTATLPHTKELISKEAMYQVAKLRRFEIHLRLTMELVLQAICEMVHTDL